MEKTAKRVFIGSGPEAGAWAHELVVRGAAEGAMIVCDQPPGQVPYDRVRSITRGLIDPRNENARRFDGSLCTFEVRRLPHSLDRFSLTDRDSKLTRSFLYWTSPPRLKYSGADSR